jgi:hypothetical protein
MKIKKIKLIRKIFTSTLVVLTLQCLNVSFCQSYNQLPPIDNKQAYELVNNIQNLSGKKPELNTIITTINDNYLLNNPVHLKSTNVIRSMLDSAYGYAYTPESDSLILFKSYYAFDDYGDMTSNISYRYDTTYMIWFVAEKHEYSWDTKGNNLSTSIYYHNEYLIKTTGNKEENVYDAMGNITKNSKYIWIDSISKWENSYKTETTFNGNGKRTEMSQYLWDRNSKTWQAQYKYEFNWDNDGNCTSNITYQADPITHELIQNLKTEFAFNDKQSTTSVLYSSWDTTNNTWLKSSKDEYTYMANQDVITEKGFLWDTLKSNWFESYKNDYTYNGNGQKIANVSYYRYFSDSLVWVGDTKTEASYYANQKLHIYTYYSWDYGNNQWFLGQREEYTYSDSLSETIINSYYDLADSKWIENGKNETNYDSKSRLTLNIFYTRNPDDSVWTGYSKREKNYDLNDNITLESDYRWDYDKKMWIGQNLYNVYFDAENNRTLVIFCGWGNNDQWAPYQKQFFFYSQNTVIIPTSIVSNADNLFKVYPNPLIDLLNIDIQDNTVLFFQLFNSSGQLIKTFNVQQGKNTYNTENLNTGLYFLKIRTAHGIETLKIIKE